MSGSKIANPMSAVITSSSLHPEGEIELERFLKDALQKSEVTSCIYQKQARPGEPPRSSLLVVDPLHNMIGHMDINHRFSATLEVKQIVQRAFTEAKKTDSDFVDVTGDLRVEELHNHAGEVRDVNIEAYLRQKGLWEQIQADHGFKFVRNKIEERANKKQAHITGSSVTESSFFYNHAEEAAKNEKATKSSWVHRLFHHDPNSIPTKTSSTNRSSGPGFNRNRDGN